MTSAIERPVNVYLADARAALAYLAEPPEYAVPEVLLQVPAYFTALLDCWTRRGERGRPVAHAPVLSARSTARTRNRTVPDEGTVTEAEGVVSDAETVVHVTPPFVLRASS